MPATLVTALDVDHAEDAFDLAQACGACRWFKAGLQLYTREGPDVVRGLRGFGYDVFLDLKLHDIPNTVRRAASGLAELDVALTTVHASGGKAMIAAAREAVEGTNTQVLAVTVLTSLSEDALRHECGLPESPGEAVVRLAQMAVEAGAHGVVCSAQEIGPVRDVLGTRPLIVTPGIRPAWAEKGDQARVMAPAEASRAGADYVVVGRPITQHEQPAEAVRLILEELRG